MKNNYRKITLIKFIFVILAGMISLSGCQSLSVQSQTEQEKSPTLFNEKMKKDKKLESLQDLRWENRIILIKEDDEKGLKQLEEKSDAVKERDIVWFRLSKGNLQTNYEGEIFSSDLPDKLNKEYFEKFNANVFLIGKDGTIKSKDKILDLKNYFTQIDSMPMRRREMKQDQ